jgi:hypothetical protein
MSKTFADLQHGMSAKAREWMPLPGRDYATAGVAVVPKAARASIEAALKQNKIPVTEDAINQVFRMTLELRRAALGAGTP